MLVIFFAVFFLTVRVSLFSPIFSAYFLFSSVQLDGSLLCRRALILWLSPVNIRLCIFSLFLLAMVIGPGELFLCIGILCVLNMVFQYPLCDVIVNSVDLFLFLPCRFIDFKCFPYDFYFYLWNVACLVVVSIFWCAASLLPFTALIWCLRLPLKGHKGTWMTQSLTLGSFVTHVWNFTIIKIRRSSNRFVFMMVIPILVRQSLYIETLSGYIRTNLAKPIFNTEVGIP